MRLALAALALMIASPAGAAESLTLRENKIGCSQGQDLIDFIRLGKQAAGNADLVNATMSQLMTKISNGLCHQYTAGTPIQIESRKSFQGTELDCIRAEEQDRCFYTLPVVD